MIKCAGLRKFLEGRHCLPKVPAILLFQIISIAYILCPVFAQIFFAVSNLFIACHPFFPSAVYLKRKGRCPNPDLSILEVTIILVTSSIYGCQISVIIVTMILVLLAGFQIMLFYLNCAT